MFVWKIQEYFHRIIYLELNSFLPLEILIARETELQESLTSRICCKMEQDRHSEQIKRRLNF